MYSICGSKFPAEANFHLLVLEKKIKIFVLLLTMKTEIVV